jgi:glycosyltransferase involved in cell wall biosynthesis
MRSTGATVEYAGEATPSRVVNIALLPVELVVRRAQGFHSLHVHWVFGFVPAWAASHLLLRRLFRWWCAGVLAVATALGMKIVSTAHNLLPHAPLFDDDPYAGRALVNRCSAIIAINPAAAGEVAQLFPEAPTPIVVPHGNVIDAYPERKRPDASSKRDDPQVRLSVLVVSRIEHYNGVAGLISAMNELTREVDPLLVVAGECQDVALREEIEWLAAEAWFPVSLVLRYLATDEIPQLLATADVVVFPFERGTTSGSVMLAMGFGSVCVVPDLSAFSSLPDDVVLRYSHEPGTAGLVDTLTWASQTSSTELQAIGEAAYEYARPTRAGTKPPESLIIPFGTCPRMRHRHYRSHANDHLGYAVSGDTAHCRQIGEFRANYTGDNGAGIILL